MKPSRIVCFTSALLLLILAVLVPSVARRLGDDEQPWWAELENTAFPHLFADHIEGSNFSKVLTGSKAKHALVEFYAPWCPHCRHFFPEFERFAMSVKRAEKSKTAATPSLLVASVDCVVSDAFCTQMNISGFPTLMLGRRLDVVHFAQNKSTEPEMIAWKTGSFESAEELATWVANSSNLSFEADLAQKAEVPGLLHSMLGARRAVIPTQFTAADHWDMQIAAACYLRTAFSQQSSEDANGPGRPLMDLVGLLSRRFPDALPDQPCRKSLLSLKNLLRTNWTSFQTQEQDGMGIDPDKIEEAWLLCDTPWKEYAKGWHSCRGSYPATRGFTCGLWTLLHGIAAASDDAGAASDLAAARAAVLEFFDCDDCRESFKQIHVGSKDGRNKVAAQLWWWRAHNIVNARVKRIEAKAGDGDPAFPKIQWPSVKDCPTCRKHRPPEARFLSTSTETDLHSHELWDFDAVAKFLTKFYGQQGQASGKASYVSE